MKRCGLFPLAAAFLLGGYAPRAEPVPPVVEEIRAEALRSSSDPAGRPLPLAAHWNRGDRPAGFGPPYQTELIRGGHHLLPWFTFPFGDREGRESYYEGPLMLLARWKLPITLVGTQWEQELYRDKRFLELPPEKNPNVVDVNGKVVRKLSPFGPLSPWREVGELWTSGGMIRKLQEWYPNPPLVILLSNNEARDLRWHEVEQSKRYLDRYGRGRDGDFKRKLVGDGWIERYRAMLRGMRDGLVSESWRRNARFVGYGNFGPEHFARWGGWTKYSLHCRGRRSRVHDVVPTTRRSRVHDVVPTTRIDPAPYAWDGGSPSYYTHDWNASTDYKVWSPQVESMNWVFMQRQVLRDRPDFWFEISAWDGNQPGKKSDKRKYYERQAQSCTPARYAGFVQFGMWLLTPRVVREFRGYLDTRERVGNYFEPLVGAVDRVYADPVLVRFWRRGRLVPNRAHRHPYRSGVPEEYKDVDRWFLLDTGLDPERPWKLDTEIPVFSLARVLGDRGGREWLVYAHSPLGERRDVEIGLPGFGEITVDVSTGGSFYLVRERGKSVTRVGTSPAPGIPTSR